MRYVQSTIVVGILLFTLLLVGNVRATTMEVPEIPPNPPPCTLGKDVPSCPAGQTPYLYKAICAETEPKSLCVTNGDSFPVYMKCFSYGDSADCTAKPDVLIPGTLTYTWTKSGRVVMYVYGKQNENASFACATTRGVASVTLTVTSTSGSVGTQTIYLTCSPEL